MKQKKHKKANKFRMGLLNRPLLEEATVFGVAALVISTVAYIGVLTRPGEMADARPPTLNTAIRNADEGPYKTSLTIKGSNFEPGATVRLGEHVAREVTYVSSSTLRAVTTLQPSAGNTIMVVNPDGQSAVLGVLPQDGAEQEKVNALDLSVLMSHIGREYAQADYKQDGIVNGADLALLLDGWTW